MVKVNVLYIRQPIKRQKMKTGIASRAIEPKRLAKPTFSTGECILTYKMHINY